MNRIYTIITSAAIILAVAVFSAVCWHSVEEIHYLKSFFPKQFSLQEAYYATIIELIKVIIIEMPIILIIAITLYVWRHRNK